MWCCGSLANASTDDRCIPADKNGGQAGPPTGDDRAMRRWVQPGSPRYVIARELSEELKNLRVPPSAYLYSNREQRAPR